MELEKLKGKEQITLTLDKNLIEKIKEIQKKELIISLSSLINELLWEQVKR